MDQQLKQMKEFLLMLNQISERCFIDCISTFADRGTSPAEGVCLDKCISKFLGVNHAVMNTFVEVQPELVKKRMAEMEQKMSESQPPIPPNQESTAVTS